VQLFLRLFLAESRALDAQTTKLIVELVRVFNRAHARATTHRERRGGARGDECGDARSERDARRVAAIFSSVVHSFV